MNFNDCRKRLWVLTVLVVALLISATANAGVNPADVRTTTHFSPPLTFGVAADGRIFAGDPFIGREVVEVRITWDVVVADGHDAADIFADVVLPIDTNSGNSVIILDGATLGWSGSGTFNHYEATDRYNGFFGQAGTGFGHQSWGLPFDAVDILPTSRIEIDYVVPEPVKYGGGSGTAEDPYQIATAGHLMLLGESPEDYDKHFILTADIDLDPNLPGCKVFDKAVIAADIDTVRWGFQGTLFTGVFDGNGHTISHLTINGGGDLGLFGQLGSEGKISNLGLETVDVNGTGDYVGGLVGSNYGGIIMSYSTGTVSGNCRVGGLAGRNSGRITASHSSVTVTGYFNVGGLIGTSVGIVSKSTCHTTVRGESRDVGGMIGYNTGRVVRCATEGYLSGRLSVGGLVGGNIGHICESYSGAEVDGSENVGGLVGCNDYGGPLEPGIQIPYGTIIECRSSGDARAVQTNAGGLVGLNDHGWIYDSYSLCTVIADSNAGGFIGWNRHGTVVSCYSAGETGGNINVGGFVGQSDVWQLSRLCFWDMETSGQATSDGGEGKTTAEMQTAGTFLDAGWDFINVWGIGENQTYPYLRKYSAADINEDGSVDFGDLAILADNWLASIAP